MISRMMSLTYLFALQIPQHDGRVTDTADMISDTEESQLESQLQKLQDETGVEIAILTIPTTDGHDIAQLGVKIGQSRWVGKKDISNGILILIAAHDRKWDISTGYGVEWVIPDIIAYRMGKEIRVPNARKQQYYRWFSEMISTMSGLIHGDKKLMEYGSEKNQNQNKSRVVQSTEWVPMEVIAIFGSRFGAFFVWSIWGSIARRYIIDKKKREKIAKIISVLWSVFFSLLLIVNVNIFALFPLLIFTMVSGFIMRNILSSTNTSRGWVWWSSSLSDDDDDDRWSSSSYDSDSDFGWWSFGGGGASGSR